AAREVLYPAVIYLVNLFLIDEPRWGDPLLPTVERQIPFSAVASGSLLEKWARDRPEQLAAVRERLAADQAEVCGGSYLEREDALLPLESQLWNLRKGLAVSR